MSEAPEASVRDCPICGQKARVVDPILSVFSSQLFQLGVCEGCRLGLVLNPRLDYENIYGADYYEGTGADPHIDYVGDESTGSVREIEWAGILKTITDVARIRGSQVSTLLDWGAGLGGLVKRARASGFQAEGLDAGYAATILSEKGLAAPAVDEMNERYDVITAIEVVEHLVDPIAELRTMARCLKPGGFLFITTGNFAKVRGPLNRWYYAQVPDVHVTFWSPPAWEKGLRVAGLDALPLPVGRVDPRIVQYKILKALPKYRRPLQLSLPLWRLPTRMVDSRYGISDFAVGVKSSA
jgi:SAM-dependent methyltransferase